ncbi:MAG: DNA mismatch repair protein MutS [Chitinophagales bacterium]|nr:DNA mismatch repair protein MutS [Chitinophagales bacterium]
MSTKKKSETPLMKQYYAIKAKHHDAILLFRVGDFYETFGEDAVVASKVLGIILTKRHNGSASEIELAGFPYHSLESYLPKLVRAGYRVAICDQLEKPSKEKKIVKRGVTELVTPGVALNDNILDTAKNNFLASLVIGKNNNGIAFIDISTGEFYVAEGSIAYLDKLMQSFRPSEVLFAKKQEKEYYENFGKQYYSYRLEDWIYTEEYTTEMIQKQFEVNSLKGFGIENSPEITIASGAALHYFADNHLNDVQQLNTIARLAENKHVWMDKFSIKNLELVYSHHHDAKTLADIIDYTVSPMGARLIKKWILMPLVDLNKINERHDVVAYFVKHREAAQALIVELKKIGDIERMIAKVPSEKISPRELVQLKRALRAIAPMQSLMKESKLSALLSFSEQLNSCPLLLDKLEKEIEEDAPAILHKSKTIKEGVNEELDSLRKISTKGKDFLLEIQQREAEATGISSLKIGFNNVFGYYLEVRNTHKERVPETWIRKQTLTGAERYITEELKEYEEKILGAQDKIQALELQLFNQIISYLRDYIQAIQLNANVLARIDCLLSFALVAEKFNYCRPSIDESLELDIKDARHPVIEAQLPPGEAYVPNNIYLDNSDQQIIMITGPNMSGKSAVLRQTALIVLMAQMGSFVPASSARIGLVDKIFTRVGASDNISSGESTFMVEMNETANIVNNISNRSLILLDEIGRGTSTYDGISIAWSIAEYLHNHPKFTAKTLFATHYHELNELADKYPRIKNYHISTKELQNKVLFLRKLTPGGSKHSFGIHVARMAGMPKEIVSRANDILKQLEQKHIDSGDIKEKVKNIPANMQLSIFDAADPQAQKLKEALESLDINSLSPIEALMKLNEWKKEL